MEKSYKLTTELESSVPERMASIKKSDFTDLLVGSYDRHDEYIIWYVCDRKIKSRFKFITMFSIQVIAWLNL